MLDFDKMFADFLKIWYTKYHDKFSNVEEMEDIMPSVYEEWSNSPVTSIACSPREYFARVTSPAELVKMLQDSKSPCELLLDRIGQVNCDKELLGLIERAKSEELVMTAMNLLTGNSKYALDLYVKWLVEESRSPNITELVIEKLSEQADFVADKLIPYIEGASGMLEVYLADVLVNHKGDNRIYNMLVKLFLTGDNTSLYASYLGKYEDERAIPILNNEIKICTFVDFLEIKNAIERLGGTVETDRDFSDDETFKLYQDSKNTSNTNS